MKRRLVALTAAAALTATGTATLVAGQASAAGGRPSAVSQHSASHLPLYAGHAYLLSADDGSVYRNTFSADGTLVTGLTVKGSEVGRTFTAPVKSVQTGWKQYFISWIEPGGLTVSQVADFTKNSVEFYVTFDDGTNTGTRTQQLHHGALSRVR